MYKVSALNLNQAEFQIMSIAYASNLRLKRLRQWKAYILYSNIGEGSSSKLAVLATI